MNATIRDDIPDYVWVYEPDSSWFPAIVDLEREFFGGGMSEAPPETSIGLKVLLSIGARFLLQVTAGSVDGCLELIEVVRLQNASPSLFPLNSPTRRLLGSGALERLRADDLLVHGWMGRTRRAMELVKPLRALPVNRVVGFVLSSDERAVRRYDRIASKIDWVPALYGECDGHWVYMLRPA